MNVPIVLPKSLHKRAAEQARQFGVTVETYLASMIQSAVNGESIATWIGRWHPEMKSTISEVLT